MRRADERAGEHQWRYDHLVSRRKPRGDEPKIRPRAPRRQIRDPALDAQTVIALPLIMFSPWR